MEAETKETSFEKQNVVIIKNNVKGANLRECMYHLFFINPFKNFLNGISYFSHTYPQIPFLEPLKK